eukprot:scaffold2152_cov252-Pinguiococcus_pyrenoidosus.AAC.9
MPEMSGSGRPLKSMPPKLAIASPVAPATSTPAASVKEKEKDNHQRGSRSLEFSTHHSLPFPWFLDTHRWQLGSQKRWLRRRLFPG